MTYSRMDLEIERVAGYETGSEMDICAFEPQRTCISGNIMRDEIEELLEDWYDWQQSYRPKLGFERVDPACRGYEPRRRDSEDLAYLADERARRLTCETVDACVSKLDTAARIGIQTEMRNRFSGVHVWSSMRLDNAGEEYQRALRLLEPLLYACRLIDRACKPDKSAL